MVCITTQEALARLTDKPEVNIIFDKIPNDGVSIVSKIPLSFALSLIEKAPVVYETGEHGQRGDMGICIIGHNETHGFGELFMETKPECRLTDEQLAESIARGRGSNIFSSGVASFDA